MLAAHAGDGGELPATGGPVFLVVGALLALDGALVAVRRFGLR